MARASTNAKPKAKPSGKYNWQIDGPGTKKVLVSADVLTVIANGTLVFTIGGTVVTVHPVGYYTVNQY